MNKPLPKKLHKLLSGRFDRDETLAMHFAFIDFMMEEEGWTRIQGVRAIRESFTGNYNEALLEFAEGWAGIK